MSIQTHETLAEIREVLAAGFAAYFAVEPLPGLSAEV